MKTKLVGSASSLEELERLISKHFYSNCKISKVGQSLRVFNPKGMIDGLFVVERRGRFRLEREV